ncbi:uncharacterized protein LOC112529491 [Cynara cardunculus var. scolymus]|uniref:uncharacterized protein LOC112529491 n=1 Tax=Cynara cardunculus var. scolymus TaxID=59895 RepID=UPI000D627E45|nr:uncharacterized protein LOC112529491 [Cynara cardunculus var. scolymus]
MNAISIGLPFSPITNPPWRDTTSDRTSYLTSLALPVQFTRSQSCFLLRQRNHRRLLLAQSTMSSSGEILQSNPSQRIELRTESDFEQIVSPDETLSICGFGSLLSERSARSTFPDLINFRVAKLNGFRRVFAHVAPIFFERGIAKPETKEVSSLSVEPCEGESLIVTVFEIKKSEIPSYIEREHEFRFLAVHPETLEGNQYAMPAVLCARYSDEEYFQNRCKGSQEIYHERYGRFGIEKIWQDDVLPCRTYCRHCVLAAKNLGDEAYANFLDHTYLADRKTTLRKYLATAGSGLMEEEPPELLKVRYGG